IQPVDPGPCVVTRYFLPSLMAASSFRTSSAAMPARMAASRAARCVAMSVSLRSHPAVGLRVGPLRPLDRLGAAHAGRCLRAALAGQGAGVSEAVVGVPVRAVVEARGLPADVAGIHLVVAPARAVLARLALTLGWGHGHGQSSPSTTPTAMSA